MEKSLRFFGQNVQNTSRWESTITCVKTLRDRSGIWKVSETGNSNNGDKSVTIIRNSEKHALLVLVAKKL